MTKIIGITGAARVGKDFTARLISRELSSYGNVVQFDSFAADMYAALADFDFSLKQKEEHEYKEKEVTFFIAKNGLAMETYKLGFASSEACRMMELKFLKELSAIGGQWYSSGSLWAVHASPRQILQALGSVWRKVNPQFWVDRVWKRAQASKASVIILTDVRFDNEADICDYVLRIKGDAPVVNKHKSEQGISDEQVTFTLHNTRDYDYQHWTRHHTYYIAQVLGLQTKVSN